MAIPIYQITTEILIQHKFLILCTKTGDFYEYKEGEGYYELLEPVRDIGIKRLVQTYFVNNSQQDQITPNKISSVVDLLRCDDRVICDNLDDNLDYICLKNGLYDIKQKILVPHTPKIKYSSALSIAYEPEAKCPVFVDFLKDMFDNDMESIENIIMLGGYLLAPQEWSAKVNKIFIFVGEGSNGKTLLFNNVFGKLFNPKLITDISLGNITREDSFARDSLMYSRLNITDEVSTKERFLDDAQIKKIAEGGTINIRRFQRGYFSIQARCKLIVSCNNLPRFSDTSHGLYRRLLIMVLKKKYLFHEEFDSRMKSSGLTEEGLAKLDIYKADQELSAKIEAELPGIFRLFVDVGQERLEKRNYRFFKSNNVESSLEEYKLQTPEYRFVVEQCEFTPNEFNFTSIKDLYHRYLDFYVDEVGTRTKASSKDKFSKTINRLFEDKIQTINKGRSGGRVYNIKHVGDGETEEEADINEIFGT